jgi:hypothetical protein
VAVPSDPETVARQIYARRRPVSNPDAQRYLLPAKEGRRIFQEEIVPDLLAGRKRLLKPTVVFLVGQHGAGKSRVASMVADALNRRGGFADLDSDLYKPYHPQYDELINRDDTLMAAYIGPDSWAWLAQAHEYVRAHKINALKPETAQDSRGAAAHMQAYRAEGFRVEVMVIAVPAAMSNQGIVSRYHEQVADRGHGRLTVQANADRAYKGIVDLADAIDRERLADEVGVFRRGEAIPRYSNALKAASQWQTPPGLRAAIEGERARTWTADETAGFLRTDARLRHDLGARWTQRLDDILLQALPHMDRAQRTADEPTTPEPRPDRPVDRSHRDNLRRALNSARAAAAAASARQELQRSEAAAEAEDVSRRQAAYWQAMATQEHEAKRQPQRTERDAEPDTEPEAGR